MVAVMSISLPEGKTAGDMQEGQSVRAAEGTGQPRWKQPDKKTLELRQEAIESGRAYEQRKKGWTGIKERSWEDLDV
jgi:hypothetical protein